MSEDAEVSGFQSDVAACSFLFPVWASVETQLYDSAVLVSIRSRRVPGSASCGAS